jgi:RND family efflux transporter MFP subunit
MGRIFIFLLSLLASSVPALAGAGHDHSHEAADAPITSVPRLESAGSELELVATAGSRELTIYLDRRDTNEPVDHATVEVSGDGIEAQLAARVDEGVYTIEADWIDEPGTKALTFVVTTEEASDLLNGTLDIPPAPGPARAGSDTWSARLGHTELWIIVGFSVLLGFVSAFAFRPMRLSPEGEHAPAVPAPPQLDVVKSKKLARIALIALGIGALLSTSAVSGPGHDHGDGGHDHGDGAHGGAQIAGDVPRKLPEGEVFLPKVSQRLLRIRTSVAKTTTTNPAREFVGTVMADPTSEGRVQAPMDGKIELAGGRVSFIGETVKAGDLLALLSPTMPVYERGYLEQLTADVNGKLRLAEQRLHRLQNITKGYVAQKEIEDTLMELESLQQQKLHLDPKSGQKLELRAPVGGVISAANARAGEVVNTSDTLFHIVDPNRLWIEVVGPPSQELGGLDAATAVTNAGQRVPLRYVGHAPALRQQARPIYFRIESLQESLAIGEVVKVAAQSGASLEGFVVPEGAVVRGPSGLSQIWEKVSAERFRPISVRTLPLDGSNLLVTAGLESGKRVVTQGAELLNQVR